jgi:hypothetical protein
VLVTHQLQFLPQCDRVRASAIFVFAVHVARRGKLLGGLPPPLAWPTQFFSLLALSLLALSLLALSLLALRLWMFRLLQVIVMDHGSISHDGSYQALVSQGVVFPSLMQEAEGPSTSQGSVHLLLLLRCYLPPPAMVFCRFQ